MPSPTTLALDAAASSLPNLVAAYFRARRVRVALLVVLALVLAVLAIVPPLIVAGIVDQAVASRATSQAAWLAILGIAALALCDALLTYARRRLAVATEIGLRDDAAAEHFRIATRLPLSAYAGGNEAALIRSFDDLDVVVEFVAGQSVDLLAQGLIILSMVALMLAVDWRMALVFLALAGLGLAHSAGLGRAVQHAADRWLPARDSRFGYIVECITSMLAIKTLSAHAQVGAPFRIEQRAEQEALQNYRNKRITADAASRFWAIATPGIGTAFGVLLLIDNQLSAGNLVLFLSVSGSLVGALSSVHQNVQQLNQAKASLQRMHALTTVPPETLADMAPDTLPTLTSAGAKDLQFSHAGSTRPTLHGLNLTIARGEHVAIVGRSGEGKTTLAHLLARLLQPTRGIIDIGKPDLPLDTHRRAVLLVPHVISVFSASLRDNVRLWDAAIGDDAVREALRLAGLEAFVAGNASGLDTVLGSRGNPLSAGQRQRLGLARMFLRRPEVLILDEATSAMDAGTERQVLDNVRATMSGRTLVVITHREAVAATFDRVLRMQDGAIGATGATN